jgi:hypothetical protein
MISHLKKTVFHLGSGWIWKRSARKNLVASQAHKGWRDRIRTRLNYAIAHELARWWLVEPKNMASNMVILYNATYIYTLYLYYFRFQTTVIIYWFQICSRVLIHSGWWTPMMADVLGWVQNTHVLSEVSKKYLLPNSDPMSSWSSWTVVSRTFIFHLYVASWSKLVQTHVLWDPFATIHPPPSPRHDRPDHKDEVTLPWARRSKRAARSAKKVRVEFPKCSVQCVLDN